MKNFKNKLLETPKLPFGGDKTGHAPSLQLGIYTWNY